MTMQGNGNYSHAVTSTANEFNQFYSTCEYGHNLPFLNNAASRIFDKGEW